MLIAKKILKKFPTSKEVLNINGILLIYQNQFSESILIYERAIKIYPEDPELYCNIGLACLSLNLLEKALSYLHQSIKLNPNLIQSHFNIAKIYLSELDIDKCLTHLNIIKSIDPNNENVHQLFAEACRYANKYELFIHSLESAIKINPDNYINYYYLAFGFMWCNNKSEALKNLERCIELNPKYTPALFNLFQIKGIEDSSILIDDLMSLEKESHFTNDEFIYFNLCLSQYYERSDPEIYIKYLHRANNLKNKYIINFNIQKLHSSIISANSDLTYYPEYNNDLTPIFIVGMPRSGSTLVESILLNNKNIYSCGEVPLIHDEFYKCIGNNNLITSDSLSATREKYINLIRSMTDSTIIIDKLPLNFLWINLIFLIFPNAKFIFTERNKFDTCFSIYKTFFGDSALPFSYNTNHISEFYDFYSKVKNYWFKIYDKNIYTISYDNIIENSVAEFNSLFNSLGFDFDKSKVSLDDSRYVQTASFAQVRGKIKKQTSYEEYKQYFPEFTKKLIP
jgi:tetratricopeptide (TPR) repeat protein